MMTALDGGALALPLKGREMGMDMFLPFQGGEGVKKLRNG